jgi:hypothetical protein
MYVTTKKQWPHLRCLEYAAISGMSNIGGGGRDIINLNGRNKVVRWFSGTRTVPPDEMGAIRTRDQIVPDDQSYRDKSWMRPACDGCSEGPLSQEGGHQGHTAWQRQKECVDQAEKGYQGAGGRRQAATPSTITNPYRGRACNEANCKTRGECNPDEVSWLLCEADAKELF